MSDISFDNTEIAFKHKSNRDLKKAKWLFSLFNYKMVIEYGPKLSVIALRLYLPIKGLIRSTIFGQFCGGESVEECQKTASMLSKNGVCSILDYSVEGVDDEESFNKNYEEILKTIEASKGQREFPFAVFKTTGIGRMDLLEKVQLGSKLSDTEELEFNRVKARFKGLCKRASESGVKIFVDAEDSWIQNPIDELTVQMMKKYNGVEAIVYNTLQMYRKDRLDYLKEQIELARNEGFKLGFKLVRGAYMEKERLRAEEMGYSSPIQETKPDTDRDYDAAVSLCFANKDIVSTCVASHNEVSSKLLADLISEQGESVTDDRFWFAQLYGMSDHISFNLAHKGYNVAKYLPYGPIISVMPYLGRRAQENSSVAGQVGREMSLIVKELNRRGTN